jgi:group I intron endonuclease
MIIYKVTNLINNKIYIGQTITSLNKRKTKHFCEAKLYKKYPFPRALLKYGKENFKWEIIDTAIDRFDLDQKEIKWINFYNSTNIEFGYNLCIGGSSINLSPEREKIRIKNLIKEVHQYDVKTGVYIKSYESVKEARNDFNDTSGAIAKVCRKLKYAKTAFGFIWSYDKYDVLPVDFLNNHICKKSTTKVKSKGTKIKVLMFSLDDVFLKEFDSISLASNFIRTNDKKYKLASSSKISMACNKKSKTAYGYKWYYKEKIYDKEY